MYSVKILNKLLKLSYTEAFKRLNIDTPSCTSGTERVNSYGSHMCNFIINFEWAC